MADEPDIVGVDLERANVARMYDYFLGGSHNFAVDRELADRVIAADGTMVPAIRELRSFMRRAVLHCVERGIDQFLDLGSGIPTVGNVHEVARARTPHARVAYVDNEAVAVHHSRELLRDDDGVTITHADLRDPAAVLGAPTVNEVLDFSRPVAVLMLAVIHFLSDDVVAPLVQAYRRPLVPGSALAISHASFDWDDAELGARLRSRADLYRNSSQPVTVRDRHEIGALFAGTELVDPGLTEIARWRPDQNGAPSGVYGGVGFVPGQP